MDKAEREWEKRSRRQVGQVCRQPGLGPWLLPCLMACEQELDALSPFESLV